MILAVKFLSNIYLFKLLDAIIFIFVKFFLLFILYFFSTVTYTYYVLKRKKGIPFLDVITQNFFIQFGCNMPFLRDVQFSIILMLLKVLDVFQNFVFQFFFLIITFRIYNESIKRLGFRKKLKDFFNLRDILQNFGIFFKSEQGPNVVQENNSNSQSPRSHSYQRVSSIQNLMSFRRGRNKNEE